MKDGRIGTLSELMLAADTHRAVICPTFRGFVKPRPAAFVIGMPAKVVLRMLQQGLYLWRKERTTCATAT